MLTIRGCIALFTGLLVYTFSGASPIAAADVDQRIDELERELDALKREVSGGAGSPDATGLPKVAAKAEGDEIVVQIGKNLTFTPAMRVQSRYSYNGKLADGHNFQIKRLRIKGKGEVLNLAKYYVEIKFDATTKSGSFSAPTTPEAENAWIEFNKLPNTNLRIGLYDIPFSRNALTSDSKLLFMDRSLIKMLVDDVGFADNTIGALFHEVILDGRLSYGVGIFDNNKTSGGLPTTAGRFALHLLDRGKVQRSRGSYANYRGSYIGEGRRLEIGMNVAYTPDTMFKETYADKMTRDTRFDLYAVGGDVFFNTGPFTFQAEYDWYKKSMIGGPVSDVEVKGGYVQAAVLLNSLIERVCTASWVPPIELAVRYQDVDSGEFDRSANMSLSTEVGRTQAADVGMNFYIRGHNLKVQTTYTYFDKELSGTSNRYQLQLQLDF